MTLLAAGVWSSVPRGRCDRHAEPISSSPSEPCTPLQPGVAGIPPAAGVPKSVKTEKIWSTK